MRMTVLLLAGVLGLAATATRAQSTCTIEVDPLDFDRYQPFDPLPNRVMGQIRVRCPLGRPVDHVELSAGQSGNYHHRGLASGSAELDYNIYADPTYRHIAGDGSSGTVVLVPRTRTRDLRPIQRFVVYGEIPAGQFQPPGEYVDAVRVVVVF